MEVERIAKNGKIELWAFDWDLSTHPAHKINRSLIGYEHEIRDVHHQNTTQEAICWSYGRTLGNIAVYNQELIGSFPGKAGEDATLACDIVEAGKMRNGKKRWWCRTHQKHWGTLGDIAAARTSGTMRCSNHAHPMSYIIDPPAINMSDYAEVGIWCSLPPALSSKGFSEPRRPRIHVHLRREPGGRKEVDGDFNAISLHYSNEQDLFSNTEITRVHVTPPAALEFVIGIEQERPMGCINCRDCGYPHLDMGSFATTPHSKHLCGNCGKDNTWSREAIASTPLKPLHDQFNNANTYLDVDKFINLDEFSDCDYELWASTPAVLWTAARAQERGIHVHVRRGGQWLIDDTFGTVIHRGKKLDRKILLDRMQRSTLYD